MGSDRDLGSTAPRDRGPRWDRLGLAAGLALGLADCALLLALGAELHLAGRDVTLPTLFFVFVITYAGLGFALGRLALARARARADARTIQAQLAALEASQRAALQNEKLAALGRLAAGVAHEVRNPLGVIRASARLVQESFDPGDEPHRACDFICDEIDRLDGLISALLSYARPAEPRLRSTSIDELIDRALALAGDELERRRIVVERETAAAPPALCADFDLLAQVLLDVLQNAAQALGEGGRVVVRARGNANECWIEVADSGPGVDPAVGGHVFEAFVTTRAEGTGLGLAMAARIVQAHGGELELVPGRGAGPGGSGACFRARLPIAGPAAPVVDARIGAAAGGA